MNHLPLVDATTLFISLPSVVLGGLIIVAASKLNSLPWQYETSGMQVKHARESGSSQIRQILRALTVEFTLFTAALFVGSVLFNYFCLHLSWQMLIAPDRNWYMRALIPATMNYFLSIVACVPPCLFIQIRFFKSFSCKSLKEIICSGKFVFCTSLLFAAMLIGQPLVSWATSPLNASFLQVSVARDLFRAGMVFSTIPISIAGLAIAFSDISWQKEKERNLKLLYNVADSQLCEKSHDELHALCTIALKSERIELADKISKHLLYRIEHGDEK